MAGIVGYVVLMTAGGIWVCHLVAEAKSAEVVWREWCKENHYQPKSTAFQEFCTYVSDTFAPFFAQESRLTHGVISTMCIVSVAL
jgi:tryptophan-rich sensory protein